MYGTFFAKTNQSAELQVGYQPCRLVHGYFKQNKFNSELSLFFLASNKHASRKALTIVSSKVPKNKLVNYFGVKFSSFKFFYKHNEITLQNNLLLIADHPQSPILHDEARLFLISHCVISFY